MPVPKNYDDLAFDPMFKNLGSLTDKNSITTAMMSVSVASQHNINLTLSINNYWQLSYFYLDTLLPFFQGCC